jgi:hypothetical protein
MMARQIGPANGKWKGGICLNEKGYRRITHGQHRNKYDHRRRIEELLEQPISYIFRGDGKIPPNMTVEHIDHIRTHNCVSNLMLLEKVIHDWCSRQSARYFREHWQEAMMPKWVTDDNTGLDTPELTC